MTLYVLTGSCPTTQGEVREEHMRGLMAAGKSRVALEYRLILGKMRRSGRYDEPVTGFGLTFMCDRSRQYDATAVCPCGHLADFLCDEPVGRGKTCDKPMCKCCRNEVAPDIDQCVFHATTQPRESR